MTRKVKRQESERILEFCSGKIYEQKGEKEGVCCVEEVEIDK